jgi:RHS repeat-associated protein
MSDASGTVVARYDYDPWGRSTTVIGTNKPDFNFTGLYQHAKSGLDMAVYRFYDPDLGRWLSRDPIGEAGGINLYGYGGNSPINRTDPLGLYYALAPWTWFDGNGYEGSGSNFYRGSDFNEGAYAGLDGLNPLLEIPSRIMDSMIHVIERFSAAAPLGIWRGRWRRHWQRAVPSGHWEPLSPPKQASLFPS